MDEFRDLDKEIARLKAELYASDKSVSNSYTPKPGDYWYKRLHEEKELWDRKVEAKDEERKRIEEQLNAQKQNIDKYKVQLVELENRLQKESRDWEDRLRIKEADLLIEKNRILSEEKIKHISAENTKLLERVAGLEGKINVSKDEKEGLKNNIEELNREKALYEQKADSLNFEITGLNERIAELQKIIDAYMSGLEREKQKADVRYKEYEQKISGIVTEKNKTSDEIKILSNEVSRIKSESLAEKESINSSFKKDAEGLLTKLKNNIGPLMGSLRISESAGFAKGAQKIAKSLAENIENDTSDFAKQYGVSNTEIMYSKIALMLNNEDMDAFKSVKSQINSDTITTAKKTLIDDLTKFKPGLVLLSREYRSLAPVIVSNFPIVPVLVLGKPGKHTKNPHNSITYLPTPYSKEELKATVENILYTSVAKDEFWGYFKKKSNTVLKACLGSFIVLSGLAYYLYSINVIPKNLIFKEKLVSFVTPYTKPSNIAYDGKYIWVCDWFSQSVYKHEAGDGFKLLRIFYFPEKNFSAITWAGGNMWSIDPWNKKINKHNSDENLTVLKSYSIDNSAPGGIAGNGKVLWTVDSARAKIYQHKLDDALSVETEYDTPGASPSGIYFDGRNLWSSDSETNKIYKHVFDNNLSVSEVYLPENFEAKGFSLGGIAKVSGQFWTASEKAGKIYRYPENSLKKVID